MFASFPAVLLALVVAAFFVSIAGVVVAEVRRAHERLHPSAADAG
jgi:hypothetical protein